MVKEKHVKHLDVKAPIVDKTERNNGIVDKVTFNKISDDEAKISGVAKKITFATATNEEKVTTTTSKKVSIPKRSRQQRSNIFLSYDGKLPIPWNGIDYAYPININGVVLKDVKDVTDYMSVYHPHAILNNEDGTWNDPYKNKVIIGSNISLEIEFYVNDNTTVTYPITLTSGTVLIDWGDKTDVEEIDFDYPLHEYESKGLYKAVLIGTTVEHIGIKPNTDYSVIRHVTAVNNWGLVGATSACFCGSENMRYISPNLSPTIKSLSYFLANTNITLSELEQLDVSNVHDFSFAFLNNKAVNLTFKDWDTSSATNFEAMFKGAVNVVPNTKNWKTSNVTNLESMFENTLLANPDVSKWDVRNVTSIKNMFKNALRATPNVKKWNTESLEDASGFVDGALKARPKVNNWDVNKVKDFSNMFRGSKVKHNSLDVSDGLVGLQ
jgi:hypothetical protein